MKPLILGTSASKISIQDFFDQYADEEVEVIDSDGVVLAHVYPVDRKQAELFEFHKEAMLSDPEIHNLAAAYALRDLAFDKAGVRG